MNKNEQLELLRELYSPKQSGRATVIADTDGRCLWADREDVYCELCGRKILTEEDIDKCFASIPLPDRRLSVEILRTRELYICTEITIDSLCNTLRSDIGKEYITAASYRLRNATGDMTSVISAIEMLLEQKGFYDEAGIIGRYYSRVRRALRSVCESEEFLYDKEQNSGRDTDLSEAAYYVYTLAERILKNDGMGINYDIVPGIMVGIDKENLVRVLLNMVLEAYGERSEAKVITISAGYNGGFATLSVAAKGTGIHLQEENARVKQAKDFTLRPQLIAEFCRNFDGTYITGSNQDGTVTASLRLPLRRVDSSVTISSYGEYPYTRINEVSIALCDISKQDGKY